MTDIIDDYLPHTAYKEVPGSATIWEGDVTGDGSLTLLAGPPSSNYKVKVTISGTDCTGTVSITGDSTSGGVITEDLTYTSARWKLTAYAFDASVPLVSITTSGFTDTHILCEYTDTGGTLLTGAASWDEFPCRWDDVEVFYWSDLGAAALSDAVMICKEEITTDDTVKYNDVEHTPLKIKPRSDLDGNEMYRKVIF
jgi:hypothetical protein